MNSVFKSLKDIEVKECELGKVCEILAGLSFKEKDYKPSGQPILKVKDVQDGKVLDKNLKYFNPENFKDLDKLKIKHGDVVIVKDAKGSVGKVGINLTNLEFIHDGHIFKLSPNPEVLDRKYLYHYLLNCPEKIEKLTVDGIFPSIRKSNLSKLEVLIPSLEIQKRIAETLDKFGEIEREIDLRQKQYEYYREFLIRS